MDFGRFKKVLKLGLKLTGIYLQVGFLFPARVGIRVDVGVRLCMCFMFTCARYAHVSPQRARMLCCTCPCDWACCTCMPFCPYTRGCSEPCECPALLGTLLHGLDWTFHLMVLQHYLSFKDQNVAFSSTICVSSTSFFKHH